MEPVASGSDTAGWPVMLNGLVNADEVAARSNIATILVVSR